MMEERKRDFDSYTYYDLTENIRHHIKAIREIRFAKDKLSFTFPRVYEFLTLEENQIINEIRCSLKMRRIMRKCRAYHWRDVYDA